jgi:hypothetical protein
LVLEWEENVMAGTDCTVAYTPLAVGGQSPALLAAVGGQSPALLAAVDSAAVAL